MTLVFAFLISLSPNLATAISCPPKVNELDLHADTFKCRKDADCVVIDEACRSCAPLAVSKRYLNHFNGADEDARVETDCLITCEACDQSSVTVSCQEGLCAAQRAEKAPEAKAKTKTKSKKSK